MLDALDEALQDLNGGDEDAEDELEYDSYADDMDEWIREKISAN